MVTAAPRLNLGAVRTTQKRKTMADTVFNAHKPARELPISKTTGDLLVAVDKQLKHLPTDVRHTYGREYILLLLEMRRLVRKANAARSLEDKADRIAEFIDAYDDLADLLKLKADTGDFPKPAYCELLLPLGSLSKQAHGWYNSVLEKLKSSDQ